MSRKSHRKGKETFPKSLAQGSHFTHGHILSSVPQQRFHLAPRVDMTGPITANKGAKMKSQCWPTLLLQSTQKTLANCPRGQCMPVFTQWLLKLQCVSSMELKFGEKPPCWNQLCQWQPRMPCHRSVFPLMGTIVILCHLPKGGTPVLKALSCPPLSRETMAVRSFNITCPYEGSSSTPLSTGTKTKFQMDVHPCLSILLTPQRKITNKQPQPFKYYLLAHNLSAVAVGWKSFRVLKRQQTQDSNMYWGRTPHTYTNTSLWKAVFSKSRELIEIEGKLEMWKKKES